MQFTFQRKNKWFFDPLGRKRFQITELVQPDHPVIKKITKGKSVEQIARYWHEEYAYDDNPPFRFLILSDTFALDAPGDFTPGDIIDHILQVRKADCAGGSIFVASLFGSVGCEAYVVFGHVSSTLNSQIKFPHAWVIFKAPLASANPFA